MSDSDAIAAADKAIKNQGGGSSESDALEAIQAQYNVPKGKYGGYFANGGYVHGDAMYPFFFFT